MARPALLTRFCLVLLLAPSLLVVAGTLNAPPASAHRDGCHAAHSCQSDSGSYVCGDTGNSSECGGSAPDPEYTAPEPAPVIDYNPPRRPTFTRAVSGARGLVTLPVRTERGSRLVVRSSNGRVVANVVATGGLQSLRFRAGTGRHVFRAIATDRSGNESAAGVVSVVTDATPPPATAFELREPSASDSRTGLAVTTADDTRFRLSVDGTTKARGRATDGGVTKSLDLPNGHHTVTLVLIDAVGNARTISRALNINVPKLSVLLTSASTANSGDQLFHVAGTPGARGRLTVPGAQAKQFVLGADGADVRFALTDRVYTGAQASVVDRVGRRGGAELGRFVVDTRAPGIGVRTVRRYLERGAFAASILAERGSRVSWRIRDEGRKVVASGAFVATDQAHLVKRAPEEGTFVLEASATDEAGNESRSDPSEVVVPPEPLTSGDILVTLAVLLLMLVLALLALWWWWKSRHTRAERRRVKSLEKARRELAAKHARDVSAHEERLRAYAADRQTHARIDASWTDEHRRLESYISLARTAQPRPPTAALMAEFKLRKDEQVFHSGQGTLIDTRSRQGSAHLEEVEAGRFVITTKRVAFAASKRRDWAFEKLERLRHSPGQTVLKVGNRQKWSGLAYADGQPVAVLIDVGAADLGHGSREQTARRLEEELSEHLRSRPVAPRHPGPPPPPPPTLHDVPPVRARVGVDGPAQR